jgi:hypothetical protein
VKHHERHHPAGPSIIPAGGLVLASIPRDNGDAVRVLGFALPRPHVRVEVTRGNDVHYVVLGVPELATVGTALLHAVRRLAGRGVA